MSNKVHFPAHSDRSKCEFPEHEIAMAVFLVSLGFRLVGIIELEDGRYDFQFEDPVPANLKPITAGTFEKAAKRIEAEIEKPKKKEHRRINSQESHKTS